MQLYCGRVNRKALIQKDLPAGVWCLVSHDIHTRSLGRGLLTTGLDCRYQREMSRLTVQLRNKKEAVRAAERDVEVP